MRTVIRHRLTDVTIYARNSDIGVVIVSVKFGAGENENDNKGPALPDLLKYKRMISGFLDGTVKDLSAIPIDYSTCSSFAKKVMVAARAIPWGTTVSYARLAHMAGYPRAIRAAASVMRRNPYPLIVPCHRVLRSDGSIGGFLGNTGGKGVALKKALLDNEASSI